MPNFVIKVKIGNVGTLSYADIGWMLDNVSKRVKNGTASGKIMDVNGNTVGAFGVE